jgi:hypothetical protein
MLALIGLRHEHADVLAEHLLGTVTEQTFCRRIEGLTTPPSLIMSSASSALSITARNLLSLSRSRESVRAPRYVTTPIAMSRMKPLAPMVMPASVLDV